MIIDSLIYRDNNWQISDKNIIDDTKASIVFLFGDSNLIKSDASYNELHSKYPNAHIVGSSSSGNISGVEISNSPIVASAVQLEKGYVDVSIVDFLSKEDVEQKAKTMIEKLPKTNLQHIFVLSEGLNINGSDLMRGINNNDISVSGGMAGDGDRFQETWVVANEPAKQNRAVAIGFYGEALAINCGYHGGWSPFGAEQKVTCSAGNVLFELDGQPALDLYKEYLGDFADDLPYSGMRFPLSIKASEDSNEVIRTLLAINEEDKSITFAGDVPEGYIARLMKPEIDILIDGAKSITDHFNNRNTDTALALVVSCVGRRIVMKQLAEEELEVIADTLGENVHIIGFYSYGEIAPFHDDLLQCQLHNQTLTLTSIYEN